MASRTPDVGGKSRGRRFAAAAAGAATRCRRGVLPAVIGKLKKSFGLPDFHEHAPVYPACARPVARRVALKLARPAAPAARPIDNAGNNCLQSCK